MEFIILGGALIVGFIIGWNAREQYAMRTLKRIIDEVESVEAEKESDAERMVLEKHNNVIYAFTVENHNFIAQGSTLEELDDAIQKRYPGKKFMIKESNLSEIGLNHDAI